MALNLVQEFIDRKRSRLRVLSHFWSVLEGCGPEVYAGEKRRLPAQDQGAAAGLPEGRTSLQPRSEPREERAVLLAGARSLPHHTKTAAVDDSTAIWPAALWVQLQLLGGGRVARGVLLLLAYRGGLRAAA